MQRIIKRAVIPLTSKNIKQLLLFMLGISIGSFSLAAQASSSANATQENLAYGQIDHCAKINEKPGQTISQYLAPYQQKLANKTGLYVLEEGTESLMTRAWLSGQAEHTIDVQYFIFSSDNIGLIAADYLVKAAERGVKVRVLIDDIMVEASGEELLKLAAHENISIKIYNPVANIGKNIVQKLITLTTNFHGLNQRMHNKTFTVDSQISITGGRNVADEYFGFDHQYNFRDRDVLLVGKSVKPIETSFEQFWQSELSVDVQKLVKVDAEKQPTTDYSALHQYACDPENFNYAIRERIAATPKYFSEQIVNGKFYWLDQVEYVSDLPGKNAGDEFLGGGGISTDRLVELANEAQQSIVIQTPYLITTKFTEDLFAELVKRGVKVDILTNSLSSNDNFEAFNGYQRVRKKLLKAGVNIYEFKPDAAIRQKVMAEVMTKKLPDMPIFGLHAKSMVIDDKTTVIGTFNLDPRSANLNTESLVIIRSSEVSTAVKQGMVEEMKAENAWQTTLDWNPDGEESVLKRMKVRLRHIVPKGIL